MTDKEKTIKELKEALDNLDITNKYRLNLIRAIEYLQEEPVSDNLDEAIGESFTYLGNYGDDSRSDKLIETAYRHGFEAGVKWKELQITIKAV